MGSKYRTVDGVEVTAKLVQGRTETVTDGGEQVERSHHDFWEITFPDGTVKEILDVNPKTGDPVFAAEFKEVK